MSSLISDKNKSDETIQKSSKHLLIRFLYVFLATAAVALAARFFIVPFLYSIDDGFAYSADIVSLDNFFDENSQMFLGEQRSVTSFGYAFVEKKPDGVIVKNFFDVRTVTGERVISVERNYGIDPQSSRHIKGLGDQDRTGYLFAPRHLKKTESFSYWHVNYDRELEMVFEKEEVVRGLNTYRYSVSFGVDQTDDLEHLEGVPEERGVNLDVSLTLWFEPVSGWLVRYRDSAIAYFYDQETGQRIHPWNKFGNQFRQSSVIDQVEEARMRKMAILLAEQMVPALIFLVGVSLMFRKMSRRASVVAVATAVLVVGLFTVWQVFNPFYRPDPVLIGITRWVPKGNLAYDENIQGFKDALTQSGYIEGEDVVYLEEFADADPVKQRSIVNGYLEKNADLIYSLTTPGTIIVKDVVPNRPVVFSVVTYPERAGLIESLSRSGNNLVGTRNWVSVEEQLSVFREIVPGVRRLGFVHRAGETNSSIQLEEMRRVAVPLGIEVVEISGANLSELISAMQASADGIDSLYSACDTLIQGEAEDFIIEFAHQNKIPSFSCNISGPFKGDLVGTVADFYQIGRLAGEKAVLILEGATPTSLETNTVARPFTYINQKTAELLGITIPQNVLLGAAEIINQ